MISVSREPGDIADRLRRKVMATEMRYFEIEADDANYPDRWFLGDPLTQSGDEIDAREFTECRYYREFQGYYSSFGLPANLPIDCKGRPVAFHLASFDMPVVSERVARICEQIAPDQIQCLPVRVESRIPGYEILNVLRAEDCIDEKQSVFTKYKPKDRRPDLIGQYQTFVELRIDPSRVHGSEIFRLKGWEIALIVSQRLKESLEMVADLGVEFREVG